MDRPSRHLIIEFPTEDQARGIAEHLSSLDSPDLGISKLRFGKSQGVIDTAFILDFVAAVSIGIGTNLLSELIYAALRGKESVEAVAVPRPMASAEPEPPYTLMIDGFEVRCRSQEDLERLLATAAVPVSDPESTSGAV